MHLQSIKYIAFDADDTLWENETFFRQAENEFCFLLQDYGSHELVLKELLNTEIANIEMYGYGIKGFTLSMIETANRISDGRVTSDLINEIILLGKDMMSKEVKILEGVVETLQFCKNKYKLILATKGDSIDQWRKLKKSGLEIFFDHVEIMNEKNEENYLTLLKKLSIEPQQILMIGNSIKSDVLPILSIGGQAVHIPFHTTWIHEQTNISENQTINSYFSMTDFLSQIAR